MKIIYGSERNINIFGESPLYAIADKNILSSIESLALKNTYVLEGSESRKTLATVEEIYSWLQEKGAGRDATIIGIGGGITTDITGFVSATYLRGTRCVLMPTTLLAMCDASIGGKNGVNYEGYKNIIGTIREPDIICINIDYLKTLSVREFRCGVAEMLKTFLIGDAKMYGKAVAYFTMFLHAELPGNEQIDRFHKFSDDDELRNLIRRCQEIKLDIVRQDLYDNGQRRVLNFGHTIAHALEKCSTQYLHGEAVAIGIAASLRFACKRGICTKDVAGSIISDFERIGLPTAYPLFAEQKKSIKDAIERDKKTVGKKINFILLQEIGKVVAEPIDANELVRELDL